MVGRWARCVQHRGEEVGPFVREYFGDDSRSVLLIAGGGFDPRAAKIPILLGKAAEGRTTVVIVREDRPVADAKLVAAAELNSQRIEAAATRFDVQSVRVVAVDGAIVGGREVVSGLRKRLRGGRYSDIVIDFSALSIGISFPAARLILETGGANEANVHVMVTGDPEVDSIIQPIAGDGVSAVHGFKGDFGVSGRDEGARIWFPQLDMRSRTVLSRIHQYVEPHDVCPLLPFPASDPREADKLLAAYVEELQHGGAWGVDPRNILYADETNPWDVYQSLLRVDDERRSVFAGAGGSQVILSPVGSKTLAIGALMAALERSFPVMYVEAEGYEVSAEVLDRDYETRGQLAHVWLSGDVYA